MLIISESAFSVVRTLIAESGCSEPIAVFGKRTEVYTASAELQEALLSDDQEEMIKGADWEWERVRENIKIMLDISICEASEARNEDLIEINCIVFQLPVQIRDFFQDLSLFYENGFVLRKKDGEIADLPFGPPLTSF